MNRSKQAGMSKKAIIVLLISLALASVHLAAAAAQQPKKVPRIGFLTASSASSQASRLDAFRQGLRELVKKNDLEGLVTKRKDGKYKPAQTLWYKILNPAYTQKSGRKEFFQRQ